MPTRDRAGRFAPGRKNPLDMVELLVKPLLAGAATHVGTRTAKAAADRLARRRKRRK